jgi:hypothetical protein
MWDVTFLLGNEFKEDCALAGNKFYPRALSQGSKSTIIRVEYFISAKDYA